jgi:hypothetical protein
MKKYMQRQSVASYFVLVFTIAWVGSILVAGLKFFRGETLEPSDSARAYDRFIERSMMGT